MSRITGFPPSCRNCREVSISYSSKLLSSRYFNTCNSKRSPNCSSHSTPLPGVLCLDSSLAHATPSRLSWIQSPLLTPDFAKVLALDPVRCTLTCPFCRRKRKSGSTSKKLKDLCEVEYGHINVTIPLIDLPLTGWEGRRRAIGMESAHGDCSKGAIVTARMSPSLARHKI